MTDKPDTPLFYRVDKKPCAGGSETCGYLCVRVKDKPVATWTRRGMEERND